jgi:hypothetical protein
MEEKLIVFISSRINDEMKRARRTVREAIEELPLTRPWLFEEAPASADPLDESYLRWVGRCDLFILLLGEDIADPVKVEWETATQARKPRLVFLNKGAQDDAAWQFAKGLDVKWKEYETLPDLKREVQAAVGDELIKGYRSYGMSERERASLQEHRLNDYLARAVSAYETRMYRLVARPAAPPDQPYKFLYAFEIEDADIFFGRDAATKGLYEKVLSNRLTVLHARSGAGKTSLLNAGLSPRLIREGRLPVYARTYDNPTVAVKRAIASPSLGPWPELLPQLSLHEFLGLVCSYLSRQTQGLVVIFDQFEEFFVFLPELDSRRPFINTLGDCCGDKSLPVHFLIGIRGDYFTDLADFKHRLPHIFHNEYRLEPMNREEATAAINQPLTRLRPPREYEPSLLEVLLDDLTQEGMDPPHLQIVCTRLYETLDPGETVITEAHYQALGRAEGILGDYLRREIEKLGKVAPLARTILTELITSENTRRTLSTDELHDHLTHRRDLHQLESVLAALVAARLLQREEIEGVARYELAHEYLISQIRAWVTEEDVVAKRMREILQRASANWRAHALLIDRNALALIHEHRELLSNPSAEETELLCRSAVAHQLAVDTWALAAHRKGVDIWPILQPALTAPDHRVRASVVAVLPAVGEAALPALGDALADKTPLVRVQAILALERLGTAKARQTLEGSLRHEVYIPPPDESGSGFYIDRYPVTNEAYEMFLRDNPDVEPPPSWSGRSAPQSLRDHPVVGVSWQDAQAYAVWAGKRLPTADEWQQAAGGQDGRRYPWGDRFTPGCCNTREAGEGGTTPVGKYSPGADSPYGVADMAGNVWEWLADEAGFGGQYRQLRGGAWFYSAEFARIDYDRFWRKPEQRRNFIGSRLCFNTPQG